MESRSPEIVVRLRRRAQRSSLDGLLVLGGIAGSGLLLALVGLALMFGYYRGAQRILPRVSVAGVNLSGMSLLEAEKSLFVKLQQAGQVQVTNGMQTATLSTTALGLKIDPSAAARSAYSVGHTSNPLLDAGQFVKALAGGWEVPAPVTFDEAAGRAALEQIAPQLGQAPQNATLRVEGERVVAVPGQLGYTINIEDGLAHLRQAPEAVLRSGRLGVLPQPVTPAVIDATPALAEAERLLNTPLSITAYDALSDQTVEWQVERAALAGWLRVENEANGPRPILDPAAIAAYLEGQSAALGGERYIDGQANAAALASALTSGQPFQVNISHRPTQYVVQAGDTLLKIGWKLGMPYWMIAKANPDVNPDALSAGQTLQIPSKDRLLPMAVTPGKRVVISISKQRMWVYQNGQEIQKFVISTGIDRSPTQPGVFQVQTHVEDAYASVWDLNMPHFLGIYEAWPGFMNGIHGLPTLSNGRRLWANILGSPASYGCIILDLPDANWLYQWAEDGTVVEIKE